MRSTATALTHEATHTIQALDHLIQNPGRDPEHDFAEMIRLAAQLRDTAQVHTEHLALTAHRRPSRLSLRRIHAVSGISLHTLRSRLAAQAREVEDPFAMPDEEVSDA